MCLPFWAASSLSQMAFSWACMFGAAGRHGNHHILIGHHDAELTARTIAAKGIMGATPELKTIALLAIASPTTVALKLLLTEFSTCCEDQDRNAGSVLPVAMSIRASLRFQTGTRQPLRYRVMHIQSKRFTRMFL